MLKVGNTSKGKGFPKTKFQHKKYQKGQYDTFTHASYTFPHKDSLAEEWVVFRNIHIRKSKKIGNLSNCEFYFFIGNHTWNWWDVVPPFPPSLPLFLKRKLGYFSANERERAIKAHREFLRRIGGRGRRKGGNWGEGKGQGEEADKLVAQFPQNIYILTTAAIFWAKNNNREKAVSDSLFSTLCSSFCPFFPPSLLISLLNPWNPPTIPLFPLFPPLFSFFPPSCWHHLPPLDALVLPFFPPRFPLCFHHSLISSTISPQNWMFWKQINKVQKMIEAEKTLIRFFFAAQRELFKRGATLHPNNAPIRQVASSYWLPHCPPISPHFWTLIFPFFKPQNLPTFQFHD